MYGIKHNAHVTLNRWHGSYFGREHEARFSRGSVFSKAKSLFPNSRLVRLPNRITTNTGFFIVAASDATDKVPTWASCTGYMGHRLPLGARPANLVKVSRNLYRLSGKMSAMRIELTRHANLVW
jgi:hypothetical protein